MLRSRTVALPDSISVMASNQADAAATNPDAVGDVLADAAAIDLDAVGDALVKAADADVEHGDVLAESAAVDPEAIGERLLLPQPRIRKSQLVPWPRPPTPRQLVEL
jgi:hypothetical protein